MKPKTRKGRRTPAKSKKPKTARRTAAKPEPPHSDLALALQALDGNPCPDFAKMADTERKRDKDFASDELRAAMHFPTKFSEHDRASHRFWKSLTDVQKREYVLTLSPHIVARFCHEQELKLAELRGLNAGLKEAESGARHRRGGASTHKKAMQRKRNILEQLIKLLRTGPRLSWKELHNAILAHFTDPATKKPLPGYSLSLIQRVAVLPSRRISRRR